MEYITNENIEKEIMYLVENEPLTCANLEKFVLLSKSMKYLKHVGRKFTEEDAKEWVAAMDPPARWTMDQTTELLNKHGYSHKPCEFWAVMNALNSDYGKTMAKFSADKPEVWAALAHDWLEDSDAEPGKVGRYWRDIVKHS